MYSKIINSFSIRKSLEFHFNRLINRADCNLRTVTLEHTETDFEKKVASEINKSNCRNVIDMCYGTGNQIKYLKKLNLKTVVGIDISDNMLAVASKLCKNDMCIKKDV